MNCVAGKIGERALEASTVLPFFSFPFLFSLEGVLKRRGRTLIERALEGTFSSFSFLLSLVSNFLVSQGVTG